MLPRETSSGWQISSPLRGTAAAAGTGIAPTLTVAVTLMIATLRLTVAIVTRIDARLM